MNQNSPALDSPARPGYWLRVLSLAVLIMSLGQHAQAAPIHSNQPEGQYVHQQWHAADGLPQETVQALTRSSEGYIWAGTQDGLARYDGHRFTLFHPNNTPALKSRWIQALAAGEDGELWVGSAQGLYHYQRGRFEPVTVQNLGEAVIRCLLRARDGALYVGTTTGLFRLQKGEAQVLLPEGIQQLEVWNLAESTRGEVAVIGSTGSYRVSGSQLLTIVAPPGGGIFRVLRFDHEGSLWFAGRGGLWCLAKGTLIKIPVPGLVTEFFVDSARKLWVGTDKGLSRILPGGPPRAVSIDASIRNIHAWVEDAEGGLWVGAWGGGLHRLRIGRAKVLGMPEGLPSNDAQGLLQSRDGAMWLGTRAGLTRIKGSERRTWGLKEGLLDSNIQALYEDEEGTLWIGTWSGLARMQGQRLQDSGLEHSFVFAITSDGQKGLWVGTWKGLVHVVDRRAAKLVYQLVPGVDLKMVWVVHRAKDGSLWLGGEQSGLTRMHGVEIKTYLPPEVPKESFYSIFEQPDGTLWFGTAGAGILRFKQGRFDRISANQGLPDDVIYAMVPHGEDGLWISSNHGVFRVSLKALGAVADGQPGRLQAEVVGVREGMRSAECNGTVGKAGLLAQDGQLWFPTTNGVVVIDPKQSNVAPSVPVVLESVLVDRKPVSLASSLNLPPGRGEVEFHFTTISFGTQSLVPLRYRLQGFDEDWRETTGEWLARYTNLPPGKYTFQVESYTEDPDGKIVGHSVSIPLVLRPHWYQRKWVQTLAAVLALGLVLLVNHFRVLRIRQRSRARQADLQRAVDEAISQLKILQGLVPVCAWCRNVRSDEGYWQQIETYITDHSEATFTHSICPDCSAKVRKERLQLKS